MALCVVTGGAGFLGSHLVEALVARGDSVRILDDLSTGNLGNLAGVFPRVEFLSTDLSDPNLLQNAFEGARFVFHFTAPPDSSASELHPAEATAPTSEALLRVLNAAREQQVQRVIYASSGYVYGNLQSRAVRESDATIPLTPTGLFHLTDEHHCVVFTHRYGLETVRLRYFNVFGTRQSTRSRHSAAFPLLLREFLSPGNAVPLHSPSLEQDWLYADDAIYATLLAADERRATGKVYNIARGYSASLEQIASLIGEILNVRNPVLAFEPSPGLHALPGAVDIARAETELGFCPRADLKQNLAHWIDQMVGAGWGPTDPDLASSVQKALRRPRENRI